MLAIVPLSQVLELPRAVDAPDQFHSATVARSCRKSRANSEFSTERLNTVSRMIAFELPQAVQRHPRSPQERPGA